MNGYELALGTGALAGSPLAVVAEPVLREPAVAASAVEVATAGELDRVRNRGLSPAPPSEPDGRFSRIRLSGQWVSWRALAALARVKAKEINPSSAK